MLVSPFPLEEFFAFCLIPIFCSKIFSLPQSFSSLAQPFTHACKHRTEQRCFWTPLSSSFFDAVFLLIPHFLFNREKKPFYLVNEIKLGAMEFAQSIKEATKIASQTRKMDSTYSLYWISLPQYYNFLNRWKSKNSNLRKINCSSFGISIDISRVNWSC